MPLWNQVNAEFAWAVELDAVDANLREHTHRWARGALFGYLDRVQSVTWTRPALLRMGGLNSLGGQARIVVNNFSDIADVLATQTLRHAVVSLVWKEGNIFVFSKRFEGRVTGHQIGPNTFFILVEDLIVNYLKKWPRTLITADDFSERTLLPASKNRPLPLHFGAVAGRPVGRPIQLASCLQLEGSKQGGYYATGGGLAFSGRLWEQVAGGFWAEVLSDDYVDFDAADTTNDKGIAFREVVSSNRRLYCTLSLPLERETTGNEEPLFLTLADYNQETFLERNAVIAAYFESIRPVGKIVAQRVVLRNRLPSLDASAEVWKNENDSIVRGTNLIVPDPTQQNPNQTKATPITFASKTIETGDGLVEWEAVFPEEQFTWFADDFLLYVPQGETSLTTCWMEIEFEARERPYSRLYSCVQSSDKEGTKQVERILTDADLLSIPATLFEPGTLASFHAARRGWPMAFSVVTQQDEGQSILGRLLRELGAWAMINVEGQVRLLAQTTALMPRRAFLAEHIHSLLGVSLSDKNDLINFINMRYARSFDRGEYERSRVFGSSFVQEGTDGVISQTGSQWFFESTGQTLQIAFGEEPNIYLSDDLFVKTKGVLLSGNKKIEIEAPALSGTLRAATGLTWYLGPMLDLASMRAYVVLQSFQALGGGRYQSDMIHQPETATNFLNHIVQWHTQRRWQVRFRTGVRGSDISQGDCILIYHPKMPEQLEDVGHLAAGYPAQTVRLAMEQAAPDGLLAARSAAEGGGDWLLLSDTPDGVLQEECIQFYAVDATELKVRRAQQGTTAYATAQGAAVHRLRYRYLVTRCDPVDNDLWEIEAEQLPLL